MRVISVLEAPAYTERAIAFFQRHWGTEKTNALYDDCIRHSADPLPQWYLLLSGEAIIGGAGMITNDFISRGDLYPWLCALYIETAHRGERLSALLIDRAKVDAKQAGFQNLYLATDHIGLYEKYGFAPFAKGYDPWGGVSTIYWIRL